MGRIDHSPGRSLRRRLRWLRVLAWAAIAVVLLLAAILAWLKWHEDELVYATAISQARAGGQIPANAERLRLRGSAGSELAGLLLRADPAQDSGYWVLHLHGNADSAFSPDQLRHVQILTRSRLNVLAFDYRGFGLSPGIASEANIKEDAETAYQELRRRGIPDERIILWGHSLGSGPAAYLAAKHAAAALVLFGAFTSIPDAASDTYPYLPVRWLVGVQFDSRKLLAAVRMPIVIAHSLGDTLIPYHHAQDLFAAAHEPKRLLSLNAPSADGFGGHMDALYERLDLLLPQLAALLGGQFQ